MAILKQRACRVAFGGVLLGMAVLVCVRAMAQEKMLTEQQVKVLYLYRFPEFVEWPKEAFADEKSPIVIGVLGDDPFGNELEMLGKGRTVGSKKFEIKRSQKIEDMKSCHIVYVCSSEQKRLLQILEALKDLPILTIDDVGEFTKLGGIINFVLEGKHVRFKINPAAAKRAGLTISSKLLKMGS